MERIEIFTGEQRRRRYIPQERAKFVAMAMQPGYRSMAGKLIQLKVNQLARRHQNGDVTYMKNKILLSVTALFLSACSSVSPNMQLATEGNDQSEVRSEEHTSELQSRPHLVCRLLLEKKKKIHRHIKFP